MNPEIDYDALLAFAVFAEHRNFTHAAAELHLSQPALHKKVKKLTEQVGVPLYTRRGRKLELTDAGKLLAAHARQVAALTESALTTLRDHARRDAVTLASGSGALFYMLGPAIQAARQGPYHLSLLNMRSPKTVGALLEARAHVAVGVFAHETPGLERSPWRSVGQMVVVPRGHRLAHLTSISPDLLADEQLIMASTRGLHRQSLERVLEAHGVPWQRATEVDGWNLMLQFVRYGMGVTLINDYVPLEPDLVGIPAPAFSRVMFEVATRQDLAHAGGRWLRDLLMGFADPDIAHST